MRLLRLDRAIGRKLVPPSAERRSIAPLAVLLCAGLLVFASACGPRGGNAELQATVQPIAQASPPPQPASPQEAPTEPVSTALENIEGDVQETASGLKYVEITPGTGPIPQPGQTVGVHYQGWLTNGLRFDSSIERNQPFRFVLGAGQVIAAIAAVATAAGGAVE